MKKIISLIMALLLVGATAYGEASPLQKTAAYVYETVKNPQVGSVGGEWAVIGLARSGASIPDEYFSSYYRTVENYVKNCNGVLHERKYTEYSRVIIALTAIGKNPADVAGYNLLTPLGDYEKTVWQGINGPVWALIALDCGGYEMPTNTDAAVQATREMYIDYILQKQLPDGGWALSGDISDGDITGMAIQALSRYQHIERVKASTDKALTAIPSLRFSNSESYVQITVAYCELGITPKVSLPEEYSVGDGFKHELSETDINLMATEQCLYAMAAVTRLKSGKASLYDMTDVKVDKEQVTETGHFPITAPGKTFEDIQGHENQKAIEALAQRGIINGKSDSAFEPDSTMTRAEFATIVSRSLGLEEEKTATFTDVAENDWFFGYVKAAYQRGIVKGVSETQFNPHGTITREEAAVMVARAAKAPEMEDFAVRNILAGFSDYVTVSGWAKSSLAFCYNSGIMSDTELEIKPTAVVTRGEIALMLFNMLSLTNIL